MDFIAYRIIDGLRCLLNLSFENICEPLYRRSQRRRPFAYVRIVFITQRVVPDSQRCFQIVFHRAQTLFRCGQFSDCRCTACLYNAPF